MNERQKQLINILAGEEYVVGKKLARLLNVSDRTIRSDVDKINSEISGLVKSSRRDGYCINNDVLFSNRGRYSSNIPQTPEERVHWMIMEMMVHNQPLSLKRLEDEIFISSYSIDRDCEKIKEILRDYGGLRLIRSSNHIRIEGNEEERRDLYKNLLSQEIHGNFLNLNALAKFFKNVDLLLISDVFQEVCKEYDYTVRETNYPMIMLHAGVAFSRIKGKHYIDEEEVYEKNKEYEISKEFFTRVCNKINAIYDEGEVYKFSHILLGRNIGMLNTNDEHKLVMLILQGIKERFDIDFTAIKGKKRIRHLQEKYGHQIQIIAGSGINDSNVQDLINCTHIYQIHASCKDYRKDPTTIKNSVSFGVFIDNHAYDHLYVDRDKIIHLIESVKTLKMMNY